MNNIKRLSIISMMLACAIVLNVLESFIPLFIPGFRLGLANVIILIMLYEFKAYEALSVQLLRIVIVGLLRGTIFSPIFFMSLVGGILAFIIMLIFSRIKIFTPIGASIMGAIFHSLGQIIVAIIIINTDAVIYYLPFVALLSLGSGILSGLIARTYLLKSVTSKFLDVKIYEE